MSSSIFRYIVVHEHKEGITPYIIKTSRDILKNGFTASDERCIVQQLELNYDKEIEFIQIFPLKNAIFKHIKL